MITAEMETALLTEPTEGPTASTAPAQSGCLLRDLNRSISKAPSLIAMIKFHSNSRAPRTFHEADKQGLRCHKSCFLSPKTITNINPISRYFGDILCVFEYHSGHKAPSLECAAIIRRAAMIIDSSSSSSSLSRQLIPAPELMFRIRSSRQRIPFSDCSKKSH
jgi:hypothetical protein